MAKFKEISILDPPSGYEHIYQMFTIKLNSKKIRDGLHTFLKKKRIFTKVYFFPIHLTEFYKKKFPNSGKSLSNTEKLSNQLLTLPLYPNMTSEEKQYLIESISEFFEKVK